jgi:flagellar biosynthesis protein FlhF
MELKRFVAADTKSAMEQVRASCGEDALIISTSRIGNKTEMICAVEIAPEEASEHSSAAAVVNMLSKAVAHSDITEPRVGKAADDSPFAPNSDTSKPADSDSFSSQLGTALRGSSTQAKNSDTKAEHGPQAAASTSAPKHTPVRESEASTSEMRQLMQTIQSEFSDLRETLQHQSTANVPIDRARAAISSFNRLIQKRGEDQFQNVLEQIQRLNKLCPGQQQNWQGAHLFLGLPGSGKTSCIMQIADNLASSINTSSKPNALITLTQPGSLKEQGQSWPALSRHAQKLNIAYFHATDEVALSKLLETYGPTHNVFIDSHAEQLTDDEALFNLVSQNSLIPHVCFPADNSLLILENLRQRAPWLVSSMILTRLDLAPDFESLVSALEVVGAQVDCVTGCAPSDWNQEHSA